MVRPRACLFVLAAAFPTYVANARPATVPPPAPAASDYACAPDGVAMQALERLLRAYERGDAVFFQRHLAPDLPGLGFVLDRVAERRFALQPLEVRVTETRTQCGQDVAVIDFAWEKRWLQGANLQPRLERGRSAVLFSGLRSGIEGQWVLSGLFGDNPFAATEAGAPGRIGAAPAAVSFGNVPPGCGVPTVSSTVTANPSAALSSPVAIAGPGACTVTQPLVFGCVLSGSNLAAPVSVISTPATSCNATAPTPLGPASGVIPWNFAAPTINISGPAGSSVPVSLSYTLTAPPTNIGGYTVTGTGSGTCSSTVQLAAAPPVCTGFDATLPVTIEVQDSDLTGATITVVASASNGDTETWTLTRVAEGLYRLAGLPIRRGAPALVPGNGRIDLVGPSPTTTVVTLTYVDQSPGGGSTAVPRTATVTLTP